MAPANKLAAQFKQREYNRGKKRSEAKRSESMTKQSEARRSKAKPMKPRMDEVYTLCRYGKTDLATNIRVQTPGRLRVQDCCSYQQSFELSYSGLNSFVSIVPCELQREAPTHYLTLRNLRLRKHKDVYSLTDLSRSKKVRVRSAGSWPRSALPAHKAFFVPLETYGIACSYAPNAGLSGCHVIHPPESWFR